MSAAIPQDKELIIPASVRDLASFRRWFRSGEFPEDVKLVYFDGNIWAGQRMERLLHGLIKTEIACALRNWSRVNIPGMTCCDKLRYTAESADLSSEPDVMFFSEASLLSGKVQALDGDATLEIEGSPDIVVEVISPSSVVKDQKTLREKYFEAGVTEYWLADSRKTPSFIILKRGGHGYVEVAPDTQGWMHSEVLGAQCRLTTSPGPAATTEVMLEMK
jgi:Uma2 family endonuclease